MFGLNREFPKTWEDRPSFLVCAECPNEMAAFDQIGCACNVGDAASIEDLLVADKTDPIHVLCLRCAGDPELHLHYCHDAPICERGCDGKLATCSCHPQLCMACAADEHGECFDCSYPMDLCRCCEAEGSACTSACGFCGRCS